MGRPPGKKPNNRWIKMVIHWRPRTHKREDLRKDGKMTFIEKDKEDGNTLHENVKDGNLKRRLMFRSGHD